MAAADAVPRAGWRAQGRHSIAPTPYPIPHPHSKAGLQRNAQQALLRMLVLPLTSGLHSNYVLAPAGVRPALGMYTQGPVATLV